jgi:ElaB/YqjD/DUF883 family membrane-anchored ribosome-binding protein
MPRKSYKNIKKSIDDIVASVNEQHDRQVGAIATELESAIKAVEDRAGQRVKDLKKAANERLDKLRKRHKARLETLDKQKQYAETKLQSVDRQLVKARKYVLGRIRFVNLLSMRMTDKERRAYTDYAAGYLSEADKILVFKVLEIPGAENAQSSVASTEGKGRGKRGLVVPEEIVDRKIKYIIGAIDHRILTETDEERTNRFLQKMIVRDLQTTINSEREFDILKDILPMEPRPQTVREFYVGKSRIQLRAARQDRGQDEAHRLETV